MPRDELKLDYHSSIELGKVPDLPKFLRVIGDVFPGAFLHLEGSDIHASVRVCLGLSLVQNPVHFKRGTLLPRCERLVARIDESLMDCLADAAEHLATPEFADHLGVTDQSSVLLEAYDLHDAQAHVPKTLPLEIREQLLAVTARR